MLMLLLFLKRLLMDLHFLFKKLIERTIPYIFTFIYKLTNQKSNFLSSAFYYTLLNNFE